MKPEDPITAAIQRGEDNIVDDLLSSGHHPDGALRDGAPLKAATCKNNEVVCRKLLDRGAQVTVCQPDHALPTALHQAAFHGMQHATLTLMAWGASTEATNAEGRTAFDVADGCAARERMTAVRRVLSFPLHAACELGAPQECIVLLERGLDPLGKNGRKQTPQRVAELHGHPEMAQIIQSWLARKQAQAALDDHTLGADRRAICP